jgi:hypothetical protein
MNAMHEAALDLAINGWAVLPLRGKLPAIKKDLGGRGVLDATTDPGQITAWWTGHYRGCNIGARVPAPLVVIDVDPRHGGHRTLAALVAEHAPLPETLTVMSGSDPDSRHFYYRRPQGKLSAARLGPGIDVKTSSGYVVVPPSIHPDTGRPYRWVIERHPVAPPDWLIELLQPPAPPPRKPRHTQNYSGPSVADQFSETTCWAEILQPHGWNPLDLDPDADGARWRHPTATAPVSATVRNGCLFVYSTNTPFEPTEAGNVHGYTRFRAWAVLNHNGDLSAAARHLRKETA